MNLTGILSAFLLAVSLCADCFAVSSCSSTSLQTVNWRKVSPIALVFGLIQTLLMFAGWMFGDVFVGVVEKAASVIGFLLLLYVGGSMILEAVRGNEEARNLNGLRNVIIGGIATSIDALSVGFTISNYNTVSALVTSAIIGIVTFAICLAGLAIGKKFGTKLAGKASIFGGAILIFIGIKVCFF